MQEIRPLESKPSQLDGVAVSHGRNVAYNTYGLPHEETIERGILPVFLHHGTPGSRLGPMVRGIQLWRAGIAVIATDRSGYGESDPNPDRTVASVAEDIQAAADALNIELPYSAAQEVALTPLHVQPSYHTELLEL